MKKLIHILLLILISFSIISCTKHKSPTAINLENKRIKKYIFYDPSNNLFATQILDYDHKTDYINFPNMTPVII